MPTLGVSTATTLTVPLGVLAVAEDLRAALLTLSSVEVSGVTGTSRVYADDADYADQPGVPMPYRAVERALLTLLTEATGSAAHAQHILEEVGASGGSIRFAIEETFGWRIVVTDDAGSPLPGDDEHTGHGSAGDHGTSEAGGLHDGEEPDTQADRAAGERPRRS